MVMSCLTFLLQLFSQLCMLLPERFHHNRQAVLAPTSINGLTMFIYYLLYGLPHSVPHVGERPSAKKGSI